MPRNNRVGNMAHKRKYFEDRGGECSYGKTRRLENAGKSQTEEEAELEKLVFGDPSYILENLRVEHDAPCQNMDTDCDSGVVEDGSSPDSDTLDRQPAWHDDEDDDEDDDSNICIGNTESKQFHGEKDHGGPSSNFSDYRKCQFENIMGNPKWAELDPKKDSDSSDSEDEILRHCGKFISKQSSALPSNVLRIKRVYDLNSKPNCEGWLIKAMEFHPSSTVGLVAGDGSASLYQVDGKNNTKLHNVQFERFPISCARFTVGGDQFIVGSKDYNYYHQYDMIEGRSLRVVPQTAIPITHFKKFQLSPDGRFMAVTGRFGNISLLTIRSNECVGNLKMNGEVEALTFNSDGSRLYTHGDSGEIYVWDMSSRTCVQRFIDDGCVTGLSLALSPNGQFLATGSNHGVVNIYETSALSSITPQPVKRLFNLTTRITSLCFNATSEILAMGSSDKDNAIKLAHFPSLTVFKNFPTISNIVRKPHSINFSLQSGFLGVGNNVGRALLYRLTHYGNY